MKKILIITFIAIILCVLSYCGYKGIKKQVDNGKTEALIKTLPEFSFYSLEDILYTRNSLKEGVPIVILYFHPNCEHCQYEATQLVNHKEDFKAAQLIMISIAPVNEIKTFFTTYQLNQLPNLTILSDKEVQFEHYFGSAILPTVLIYSKDWQLKNKYKGEIKIEAIINCLK